MTDEYVEKWLIKARNDIKVAENELSFNKNEIITEAVCFHAQQAAEKFLKAYLITKNIDFGKTHNLEYLIELCSKEDADFKTLDTGNLSFYAVEARYPDNFYIPSTEEAEGCMILAKKIMEAVLEKLECNG